MTTGPICLPCIAHRIPCPVWIRPRQVTRERLIIVHPVVCLWTTHPTPFTQNLFYPVNKRLVHLQYQAVGEARCDTTLPSILVSVVGVQVVTVTTTMAAWLGRPLSLLKHGGLKTQDTTSQCVRGNENVTTHFGKGLDQTKKIQAANKLHEASRWQAFCVDVFAWADFTADNPDNKLILPAESADSILELFGFFSEKNTVSTPPFVLFCCPLCSKAAWVTWRQLLSTKRNLRNGTQPRKKQPIQCVQFATPPQITLSLAVFWVTFCSWSYVWCLNCLYIAIVLVVDDTRPLAAASTLVQTGSFTKGVCALREANSQLKLILAKTSLQPKLSIFREAICP